jgi:hypothetical protein
VSQSEESTHCGRSQHRVSMLRMQTVAFIVVAAAGLWLIGVALLMALRPRRSLDLLGLMVKKLNAAKWPVTLTEQGLRILAGAALIVRSPASKLPGLFAIAGWLLLITSVLVIVVPGRWHVAYGVWWFSKLTPGIVRALAPVPAVVGGGLIYLAS